MQNESSAAGDVFAWLFLLAIFVVLFVVPIWLMIRHYKNSKPKIEAEKKAYQKLTPLEKERHRNAGFENIAGVLGLAAGVYLGTRILDNFILGIVLGAILGGLSRFVAEKLTEG